MNVNEAAFYTVSTLALATSAAAFGAVFAQTTTTLVACMILAGLGTALSAASVSAWASLRGRVKEEGSQQYFEKLASHLGVAAAVVGQFFAQSIVLAGVTGLTQGISAGVAFSVSQSVKEAFNKK